MSSKNVMLTIGIPTYNGCKELEECIVKILTESYLLDQIEILICDNASNDNTENVMHRYTSLYPNVIRYIRHDSNLGMDRNFWSCIKNAQGEFVHLMGDDDYYTNGGLRRLVNILNKEHDLDAICLSNNYLNVFNDKILDNKEASTKDILCESGSMFFLSENLKTLTLSNIVVKKSKCLEIENIERLFGSSWFHLGIITEIIKPLSKAYIFNFNDPLVTVRIGNQRWLEKDGAVSYYYRALLTYSHLNMNGYSKKEFNHIKTLFWQLLSNERAISYKNNFLNAKYCFKLFKFYYDEPFKYLKFVLKLIFLKNKPFFDGWNDIN